MVIRRKVPWKRAEREAMRPVRPIGAQALAVAVVVLALLFIYHGTLGRQLLSSLDGYLSGAAPAVAPTGTVTAPVDSQGGVDGMERLLATIAQQVKAGEWTAASGTLTNLEENWLSLQGTFSRAGVNTSDLNAVTADISELALALAAKNSTDALSQVTAARHELEWITTNYLNGTAPTMAQMATVIQDLNHALAVGDWAAAKADGATLAGMMQAVERGF
jgi:uncharacterized membrane protein YphA (DoxX/SURF4 family)